MSLQPLVAVAAWRMPGVPVRCTYGRIESMAASTKRHPAAIAARAACDAEGRLVAFAMEADFNTGPTPPGVRRSQAAFRSMPRVPIACRTRG